MKICNACGSGSLSGEVLSKYVELTGTVRFPGDKQKELELALYGDRRVTQVRQGRLVVSEKFDPTNIKHYKSLVCVDCGADDFIDKDICPNCARDEPDLVACHHTGSIICVACRDRWCCNQCAHNECRLHPNYDGEEGPKFAKKVQADWLQPVEEKLDPVAEIRNQFYPDGEDLDVEYADDPDEIDY
jgi:hypothetical protein